MIEPLFHHVFSTKSKKKQNRNHVTTFILHATGGIYRKENGKQLTNLN